MTNIESRPPEIAADNAGSFQLVFAPSDNLAKTLRGFSLTGKLPVLRSSRTVELGYNGGDIDGLNYVPEHERWMNEAKERLLTVKNRRILLATFAIVQTLESGALDIGLKLAPNASDLDTFGVFAEDEDGDLSKYVDVHAVISSGDGHLENSRQLSNATGDLDRLLGIHRPAVYQRGGPSPVLERRGAYINQTSTTLLNLDYVQ